MPTPPLWQSAAALSARAHQHQRRKDGVTPYASHPVRVALTCSCLFGNADDAVIAAALLHDVIEDTGIDYDDIAGQFGSLVADIVAALSKDARLIESEREPAYDRHLAAGPWQARLIKLADVYDNLSECIDDDAKKKQLGKVDRALKLADGDAQCREACRVIREYAGQVRKTLA